MFEDLEIKKENSKKELKSNGVNEFIISHNKDFSKEKKQENKKDVSKIENLNKRIDELEKKGKKRGKRYSLIGIIGGLLIALIIIIVVRFILFQTKNISQKVDESVNDLPNIREEMENKVILRHAWMQCEKDNDCVETKINCCDCYQGGEQVAINRKYFDTWYSLLNKNCDQEECLDVDNCTEGKISCQNHLCRFVALEEIELEKKDYYDLLKDKCVNDVCCLSSLDYMKNNNYLECSDDKKCPEGFECVSDDCSPSLSWCGPVQNNSNIENTEEMENLKNIDSDQDGLSDEEEIFYGTDKNNPDTDGDTYLDGDEVKNGYNPLGDGKL